MDIGRLITAMVTPFDQEGRVDYAQAKRLAAALLDSGSDGVLVAGTTGESPTLSHEEKLKLFAEVKDAVGDRGAVLAGTSTYDTAESVQLSREAERAGVDGLLLTTPYYSKPPQEGLYRHFAAIAEATSLPCIPYTIPGRTGVNVTAETMVRLSRIPNIAGVKEASGDLLQIARIAAEAEEGFHIWSGDDQLTLPIMAVGGYGAISVVAHLAGGQIKGIIEAYVGGRVDEAAKAHQRLLPLVRAIMTTMSNPIPVRHALNGIGFRVGSPRLPLVEPDTETGERIMNEVRRNHIDLAVAV
jgi:4-hydroxy-tetrahydrodipicolinate synthase